MRFLFHIFNYLLLGKWGLGGWLIFTSKWMRRNIIGAIIIVIIAIVTISVAKIWIFFIVPTHMISGIFIFFTFRFSYTISSIFQCEIFLFVNKQHFFIWRHLSILGNILVLYIANGLYNKATI